MLDLRWPMGMMFALVGAILAIYGVFTQGGVMYQQHSLGINVNFWWGLVLMAFGLAMLGLAWMATAEKPGEGERK